MKVAIDHHIIVKDELELPDKCPECSKTFFEPSAILCFEYQDQERHMHLEGVKLTAGPSEPDEYDVEVGWEDELPQQGESWLYLEYQCANCRHVLGQAEVKQFAMPAARYKDIPEPPAGIKDMLNLT